MESDPIDFMQTVNIHEAKTRFSRLVEQVEAGEEIVIARAGMAILLNVNSDCVRT